MFMQINAFFGKVLEQKVSKRISWFVVKPSVCCPVMHTYAIARCLFVMFVYFVETNKQIFKNFSPSGSHTILVFL